MACTGTTTIVNSTFTGNTTVFQGGAIVTTANATIVNCTIANNSAPHVTNGQGGGLHRLGGTMTVKNSIVYGNTATVSGPNCQGAVTSGGYNIEGGTDCGFTSTGDQQNTNPSLGALADNGGETQTMAITNSSAAYDKIPNATNGCGQSVGNVDLTIDQIDKTRPTYDACDVGALELQPAPTPTPTPPPPSDPGTYYTVTVTRAGTGSGSVTGAPMPITWSGNTGVVSRPEFSIETLTATASAGSVFAGWSGDCSGIVACTMAMTKNYNVTATFNLPSRTLTVSRLGTGSGNVAASSGVLTWVSNSATAEYQDSTVVTLTAIAPDDSTFTGWGGDCKGTETTCTVKMTSNLSVTATFTLKPRTLTVTKTGSGNVTVSTGSLTWTDNKGTAEYPDGTKVTLTATAPDGSTFGGWSGDCTGINPVCTVTMSRAVNVTAKFGVIRKLDISITGKGMVTASKGIIYWNFNTGVAYYADGTEDTLTATAIPDSGSTLKEWTGCDATDGARCIVKMTDSKTVTAIFSKGIRNDFDGNDKSDVFLQDSSNGDTAIWLINGMSVSSKGYPAKGVSDVWRFLAKVDFDGDGKTDVLWQHANGDVGIWFMNATNIAKHAYVTKQLPAEWQLKGVGDFNGDGKTDILWQHTNGDVSIWLMNGAGISINDYVEKGVPLGWQIKGVGDFDGDNKADILWQDANGDVAVWFMDALTVKGKKYLEKALSSNWQIKGVGDFNGDGKADIMLQDGSSSITFDVAVWLMDGATITAKGVAYKTVAGSWQFKDSGDYDGDDKADMLWQDSSTGDVAVWFMNGTGITGKGDIEKALPANWLIK
ncbi:repeat protein [Candidatus Magnetobacterium bavaricum]|uniref:Repeat protein n=1 Tax=Candidatus Magnetobacterium bavaricum TaxID=29290 RepID=A0A0F3GNT7_9BACT|nr:repeat protein [Candidatus Magnetobacterium bavaricum]